ncbi:MAG: branched-chain amino acid aminotransferase [Bacteroidales bacterium]|nr:branched-chain amino acid aminotransferase [Bacteroidales bacterium]
MNPTLDWKNLPFGLHKTNSNIRYHFKDGAWGNMEVHQEETFQVHIAATALHYGQEVFEGLKAYRGKDGQIRLFRWQENAARMQESAKGILMAEVPQKIFEEGIKEAVRQNKEFIPPYGTGGSLYIRPLLLGTGAQIGVKPAKEYMFMVFVTPVGPYFKEGFKPVDLLIVRESDRSAPLGTGRFKVGGNYAASLSSIEKARALGYASSLYLDCKEKKYIDEAGPANFFGIKNNTYITPKSTSILPSITNMSIKALAKEMGMEVEVRPVPVAELEEFEEVGACGTAAVISPIKRIDDPSNNKSYLYCPDGQAGPKSTALYNKLTAMQFGDEEDTHGWIDFVE